MLPHGRYRFFRRKAACKNEYCTYCRRPTLAEGYRALWVIHIYFIPLIPLGFLTEWCCSACGHPSLGRRPISTTWGGASLAAACLGLFVTSMIPADAEINAFARIAMYALFGALAIVTIVSLLRSHRLNLYRLERNRVRPLSRTRCPYCHRRTIGGSSPHCAHCHIRIE